MMSVPVEHARERVNEQCLGEAWHADNQAVAADEERDEHLIDGVLLSDDDLAELGNDPITAGLHLLGQGDVV
jgi:hypothetical protein